MRNAENIDFSPCMPYQNKNEFREAWSRILGNPALIAQVKNLFPGLDLRTLLSEGANVSDEMSSAEEFQRRIISRVMAQLVEQTTQGLSVSGLENLASNSKYVILSNHRDILCDPAWVAYLFFLNHRPTPKICLGDNLLCHPAIVDLVKMNKGVTVKRGLPPRELLSWSYLLSSVIAGQIREGTDSVWLAQREGRAKDGDDRTHSGVLKMLAMSGDGSLLENLDQLHILPLAISYEFDPCDAMKAYELFLRARDGVYKKKPREDAQSMMCGIVGYKGRVHLSFGVDLSPVPEAQKARLTAGSDGQNKKGILEYFCSQVDRQIHSNYRLWPSNFIALDLIQESSIYAPEYSSDQKAFFMERLEAQLEKLRDELPSDQELSAEDWSDVRMRVLDAYATPVRNFLSSTREPRVSQLDQSEANLTCKESMMDQVRLDLGSGTSA